MRYIWVAALLPFLIQPAIAADRMVIHEWGTFTSLQDETGSAVGGIDEDVEPLPGFVHNIDRSPDAIGGKGIGSASHPEVTMRLETPVVYFHPPSGWSGSVSYSASFIGGLLTQFYPDAQTNVKEGQIPKITPEVVGTLNWPSIMLGIGNLGPLTDSHVWLAPRDVQAAEVTVGENGSDQAAKVNDNRRFTMAVLQTSPVPSAVSESERFLFYRGIGHVDAPIKIVRQSDGTTLKIVMQARLTNPASCAAVISGSFDKLWYVDVRSDGTCAFKSVGPLLAAVPGDVIGSIDTTMKETEYSHESLDKLRGEMREGLIAQGLFADEAEAMVKTWENAYFKSPGTRVFYLVPRTWTDQVLPVQVSEDADLTRVMVGRIDLITPQDRAVLQKLADGPGDAKDTGVTGMLKELGRFAKPMLKDQMAHHPSASLEKLVAVLPE